jgi:hypothetical protein
LVIAAIGRFTGYKGVRPLTGTSLVRRANGSSTFGAWFRSRHLLAGTAIVAAVAAAFAFAIGAPAPARASTVLATATATTHSSSAVSTSTAGPSDYVVGDTYRANDEGSSSGSGGFYLAWNGTFKGQMRTTGDATTLLIVGKSCSGGDCAYQISVDDGTNCLEYDGSDTAVIADTCTGTRASQWWFPNAAPSAYGTLVSEYNGCIMFAAQIANGALVNCESTTLQGDYYWKIYPHS